LYRKIKSFSENLIKVVIKIKLISVNLPESYLKVLELLVVEGKFPNRSEAIRVGIRDLIRTEYLIEESVKRNMSPSLIQSGIENEVQEII
jgi:Arc/MetJ-type ribon-helix-helix transcriptional regulator